VFATWGDFGAVTARSSHFALERGVAGRRRPALRGQDYGLRGVFALDATAKSGVARAMVRETGHFPCRTRRADAPMGSDERADNPRLNVNVKGRWNVAPANLVAKKSRWKGRDRISRMFFSASLAGTHRRWNCAWIHWDSGI